MISEKDIIVWITTGGRKLLSSSVFKSVWRRIHRRCQPRVSEEAYAWFKYVCLERFSYLDRIESGILVFQIPFDCNIYEVPVEPQLELIDLQENGEHIDIILNLLNLFNQLTINNEF